MSHSHSDHIICAQCGCDSKLQARLGCDTVLWGDTHISCLNKERRMSTVKSLTAEECATINLHLNDREKRHILTTYLEDIQPIRHIINRFRGAWETYNNIPLFREPSPGSTHESESQYTLAQRLRTETQEVCDALESERLSNELKDEANVPCPEPRCIGYHHFDVYCDRCCPDIPDAEPPNGVAFEFALPDAANEPLHGFHFSSGKPPLALIPRSGTRALAEVFAFGTTKYALHNWRKGILWSELLSSAKRHLDDFIDGEDNDRESGITHLAHAAWNCFALIEYLTTHPELDDRYSAPGLDDIHPRGEEEKDPFRLSV